MMARGMRNAFLRHPWLAPVTPRRPLLGPNMLAQMEFLLSAVDGLGLGMDEMVGVIRTVDAFVRGYTQNELAEQQWRRPWAELTDQAWHREALPYVQHIAESGRYPYFHPHARGGGEVPRSRRHVRVAAAAGPGRTRPRDSRAADGRRAAGGLA